MTHRKGLNSAGVKDADQHLKRALEKFRNPPLWLPTIENIEDSYEEVSDELQGEGLKIIIASKIIDIYTRLEVLPGLKISGHTDALTEESNLIHDL